MKAAVKIPLTRGLFATVDAADVALVSRFKWNAAQDSVSGVFYAHTGVHRHGTQQSMHCLILGIKGIDHKDGDGLNNRRCNLRAATQQQNVRNQRKRKNCSSRYKGVCYNKSLRKWIAQIQPRLGVKKHIGCFDNEIAAARAYDAAAVEYFGAFARLNFPPRKGEL